MAPDSSLFSAAAIRLLARLDEYTEHANALAERWPPDEGVYARTDALLKTMQGEAMTIPDLTFAWTQFLISHAELIRAFGATQDAPSRLDLLEKHVARVLDVQSACLRYATEERLRIAATGERGAYLPSTTPGNHSENAGT